MRTSFCAVTCLAIVLAATGCSSGPKLVKVKGTLLNNKKPLKAPPKGSTLVSFIPIVEKGQNFKTYPTKANAETGAFELPGEGIPVGKYRITIMQMGFPNTEAMESINQRFSKAETTPIEREITSDEMLTIDLANPTGK